MKKQILVAILLLSLLVPVVPVGAVGGITQPIFGGIDSALDDTNTEYNTLQGAYSWKTVEAQRNQVVSSAGIIKDLRIVLEAAPGAAKSYTITLMLNGAPSALTVTITGAVDTTGADTDHDVTVAPGDYVSLRCVPDNTPAEVDAYWSTMFEASVSGESLLLLATSALNTAATEYGLVTGGYNDLSATENTWREVIPTDGTIKNLYVKLSEDPGTAPDAYRFTLRIAGVSKALTVTITDPATTGSNTVSTVAVSAGDIVTMMIEPLNGPSATPYCTWGMTFVSDIDGESIVMGEISNTIEADTYYLYPLGCIGRSTVEDNSYSIGQAATISKLNIFLNNDPGAGNSYVFTIRSGLADTDLVTTIAGTDVTGDSASLTDTIGNAEYMTLRSVPVSGPDAAIPYWGFVVYTGSTTPINDACDSDAVFSRNQDGWVNVTVSDYLIADLATVDMQVNTTGDYENFTLRWTQATNTFSELSDPDNICTLNTTLSTRVNLNETADQICFCFTITGGASGDCDVRVTTTDDDAATDIDTYNAEFEFSYYSWDELVYDRIDSAFEQFGLFNYMAQITAFINGLVTYFEDSLTHLLALVVQQFRVITNVYNFVVFWITALIGVALDFSVFYQSVLDGTSGWGTGIGDFWAVIGYDLWAPIVPLMLFLWWLESLSKRGAQTVGGELQVFINDMNTAISIVSYFVGMFSFVANTIIDRVYGLFDAIV